MQGKKVSILGCGWLGFPLARQLRDLGFNVKGSTTSPDKISLLKESKIDAYVLECQPDIAGSRLSQFFDSDVLFLNIPFSRKLKDPQFYIRQIESVCRQVEKSSVNFLIFASSTSVYPEELSPAREDSQFNPDNERSQCLWNIEKMLFNSSRFQATVLRFGGLYGGARRIGKFMAARQGVEDGPVNLVHLDDCIAVITRLIQEDIRGEIFNVCSDGHPMRKELYTKAAKTLGLEPPQFVGGPVKRKIVDNSKLKNRFKYKFLHPDPLKDISDAA